MHWIYHNFAPNRRYWNITRPDPMFRTTSISTCTVHAVNSRHETHQLSRCHFCRYWWHRRVPPVTTKLASWKLTPFSGHQKAIMASYSLVEDHVYSTTSLTLYWAFRSTAHHACQAVLVYVQLFRLGLGSVLPSTKFVALYTRLFAVLICHAGFPRATEKRHKTLSHANVFVLHTWLPVLCGGNSSVTYKRTSDVELPCVLWC